MEVVEFFFYFLHFFLPPFFSRVHAPLELAVLVGPSVRPSVTFLKLQLFKVIQGTLWCFRVFKGTLGYFRVLKLLQVPEVLSVIFGCFRLFSVIFGCFWSFSCFFGYFCFQTICVNTERGTRLLPSWACFHSRSLSSSFFPHYHSHGHQVSVTV